MADTKILSCAQAVEAAVLLFGINTQRDELATMAGHAALPTDVESIQRIYVEWLAFIHAAIVYSLMHRAPAAVVATYLRTTTELMQHHAPHEVPDVQYFIEVVFSPYMECLAQERQQDCPALFIQRVKGLARGNGKCWTIEQAAQATPRTTLRVISGVMAMALSSILDALSQYDMQAD